MIREVLKSKHGYDIPVIYSISGNEEAIVIISHGLGSSKGSPTVKLLGERLEKEEIGYIAFDFPGHGDSPVDGRQFRIENCVSDLQTVEKYAKSLGAVGEIMYFSSSFGAYINLIYLSTMVKDVRKTFLRSAAVNMPEIFKENESEELKQALENDGYFILDHKSVRPLMITKGMCDDLGKYDVFKLYKTGMAQVAMIHGDADESASYSDALRFAREFAAQLITVEGGLHSLSQGDQANLVMDKAIEFFK